MTIEWNLEVNVVVVGGGACGIAAALTTAEKGLETMLIEKQSKLGGNTILSTGSIPAANTKFQRAKGIEDSPLKMAQDLYANANNEGDWELLLHLCEQSSELVEWLVDEMEVNIDIITEYKHVGHSQFRLHAPKTKKGDELMKDLAAALDKQGVMVGTNIAVTDLITDDNNNVIGIKTEVNNQEEYIKCSKVILGTNGFGANKEMVKKYCPEISGAPYFGAVGSTGEGIIWGEKLGAELKFMGAFQGYAAVSTLGSIVSWTTVEKGGFLLNKDGQRFCDESIGYSGLAGNVQKQKEGETYVVFDHEIFEQVLKTEEEFKDMYEFGAVKGPFSTLEDLAKGLNLPVGNVTKTWNDYMEAYGSNQDPFGRDYSGVKLLSQQLYAVKATSGLFHTQGGLSINKNAQILTKDGEAIPNVYAGGGVAVGISGTQGSAGYSSGNGLLTAFVWGRIAGKHAAQTILEERNVTESATI